MAKVFLKEYKPSSYIISHVNLEFHFHESEQVMIGTLYFSSYFGIENKYHIY